MIRQKNQKKNFHRQDQRQNKELSGDLEKERDHAISFREHGETLSSLLVTRERLLELDSAPHIAEISFLQSKYKLRD